MTDSKRKSADTAKNGEMPDKLNTLQEKFQASEDDEAKELAYQAGKSVLNQADREPEVTRHIKAAFALIKKSRNRDLYLAEFDPGSRRFQVIGGKSEPEDDTSEATAIREIKEELNLPEGTKVEVTPLHLGMRFRNLSPTTADFTDYTIDAYLVRRIEAPAPVDSKRVKWMPLEKALGENVVRLLTANDVIGSLKDLPATEFYPE